MIASYPDRFEKLLRNFKGSAPDNYIGQGNPGANILIIGKETTTTEEPFVSFETFGNFSSWQKNQKDQVDFSDIPDWETANLPLDEKYNPLFPYNSHRVGWSKTWDAYQRLINHLLPTEMTAKSGQQYNFWQYSFITELSTNNMNYSRRNVKTAESVRTRLNGIFQQDFFQRFPIIIFAVFRYKNWYDIDIEKCFNQVYVKPEDPKDSYDTHNGKIPEFIHKHINFAISEDGKPEPHLLLHTNHFAMRSNKFIEAVANECKKFMDEYCISILESAK